MVTVGNFDVAVIPVASGIREHVSGDSGGIGLERQNHHVGHQSEMLSVIFGLAIGAVILKLPIRGRDFVVRLKATFDFSNPIEVFLEFLLIISAELVLQSPRVFRDEIENALLHGLATRIAFLHLRWTVSSKEPFENGSRIGFLAYRR